jgi:hypothetical protein
MTTGDREERLAVIQHWNRIRDDEVDRLELFDQYAECFWKSRFHAGEFDFGDQADLRRCLDVFQEIIRARYVRSRANALTLCRCNFAWRSLFYQLQARVDVRAIAEDEVTATGWDRSDYAQRQP